MNWERYNLPDMHTPPERDAVGLMDGDKLPHGAGDALPVFRAPDSTGEKHE